MEEQVEQEGAEEEEQEMIEIHSDQGTCESQSAQGAIESPDIENQPPASGGLIKRPATFSIISESNASTGSPETLDITVGMESQPGTSGIRSLSLNQLYRVHHRFCSHTTSEIHSAITLLYDQIPIKCPRSGCQFISDNLPDVCSHHFLDHYHRLESQMAVQYKCGKHNCFYGTNDKNLYMLHIFLYHGRHNCFQNTCDYKSDYLCDIYLHHEYYHCEIQAGVTGTLKPLKAKSRCYFPECKFQINTIFHCIVNQYIDKRPGICPYPKCEYRCEREEFTFLHHYLEHRRP